MKWMIRLLSWQMVVMVALVSTVPLVQAQTAATGATQPWPTRPVRLLVGFSPGSATDITARLLAPKLGELWGQPVVVENRSGAGSSIASTIGAQATPDGYTILQISAAFAINAVLRSNSGYDPLRDFASVAQIGYSTGALVVTPTLGVKTVKELIAVANERPGKILYGSAGAGSGIHFTAERFRMSAGIKTTHVAFKGQPEMLIEILAGRVHYGIPGLGPALGMIRDGRLIALAMVTPKRSSLLPEVPALVEILPTFRRDASHALMVPAKTPRHIINKISRDAARVLEMPDVKKQMEAIDFIPAPTSPEEFDKILRGMLVTFDEVARAAGLKAP
jgi:tripartite-type tricarboxylate transporter receptor subunit TctC